MRTVDLIAKKRAGGELSAAEITDLIRGYTAGSVPDYQMAAWAMAVCWRGMSAVETAALTLAMADSGDRIDLSAIPGIKVDKHSTGGVGDKTTLVLVPLVAAAGAPVAKMSGRSLGHTGGTLDKLQSIPGFGVEMSLSSFISQVRSIGAAVVGQTGSLVPADKKLYALRDVTATVDSIPLIAASVMAKKIAGGADAIVLDVKAGRGAFMPTVDDGFRLAEVMVAIGREIGKTTVAYVSAMDQPLGNSVGNALEVQEAIETLRGFGPPDLEELCLELGARMLTLARVAADGTAARRQLVQLLRAGRALAKFKELVAAQGGDVTCINQPIKLPRAPHLLEVPAPAAGIVRGLDALAIGRAATALGAGRATKDTPVDPAVGIVLKHKIGAAVALGEPLAVIHAATEPDAEAAAARVAAAYEIGDGAPSPHPLLRGLVTAAGSERF